MVQRSTHRDSNNPRNPTLLEYRYMYSSIHECTVCTRVHVYPATHVRIAIPVHDTQVLHVYVLQYRYCSCYPSPQCTQACLSNSQICHTHNRPKSQKICSLWSNRVRTGLCSSAAVVVLEIYIAMVQQLQRCGVVCDTL